MLDTAQLARDKQRGPWVIFALTFVRRFKGELIAERWHPIHGRILLDQHGTYRDALRLALGDGTVFARSDAEAQRTADGH